MYPAQSPVNTGRLLNADAESLEPVHFQTAVVAFSGEGVQAQSGRIPTYHSFRMGPNLGQVNREVRKHSLKGSRAEAL
jgi:hypothetical protein